MLLECLVGVHRNPLPSSSLIAKLDKAIPGCYLRCFLRTQVLFLAFYICEAYHLRFCGIELQLLSFCSVDSHSDAGFDCSDNLDYVAPCCHLSEVVHDRQLFDSGDDLLNPIHECWHVNFEEHWRHWCTQWYTCFHRVSLHHITLENHLDHSVHEKTYCQFYEVSFHPVASNGMMRSSPPYTRKSCLDVQ